MSISKCDACPLRGRDDVACIGNATGQHGRLCAQCAAGNCRVRRQVVEASTGTASGIDCPDDPARPLPGPTPPAVAPPPPAPADLAVLELGRRMWRCPHRTPAQDKCPDCFGTCSRPDRPGPAEVERVADCFPCLREGLDGRFLDPRAPLG